MHTRHSVRPHVFAWGQTELRLSAVLSEVPGCADAAPRSLGVSRLLLLYASECVRDDVIS